MEKSGYYEIMERRTGSFLAGSMIYGVVFAVLLYRNMNGIGVPVLMLATCLFMKGFFRVFGIQMKKETICYMGVMVLLGISTVMTTSDFLIMFNWLGSIFLFFFILIHQFYEDRTWNFIFYIRVFFRMMFAPLGNIMAPVRALMRYGKKMEEGEEKHGNVWQVICGVGAAALLLSMIIPLLFSGDLVFASIIRMMTGNITFSSFAAEGLILFAAGFLLCFAVWKSFVNYTPDYGRGKETERPVRIPAVICISILTAVYVMFCIIQVISLFFGHGLGLPEGYTYAEYARTGFFELLGVSIINLAIVLTVIHLFQQDRKMQKILTAFCVCTFIMIASSAYRMCMYIGAYQFTLSRVLVLWGLCVLSFIFSGVIVNVYKKDFPLFRYIVAICASFYLILSFSRPDEWMARYNLRYKENWVESYGEIRYLFSQDLLLALDDETFSGNPANLMSYCQEIVDNYDNPPGWTYSIGEARAKKAAEQFLKEYGKVR